MQIGKVPENVLERSVLRQLTTKRDEVLHGAGIGEDCAIFSFSGAEAMAACMQEAEVAADADAARGLPMADLIQKCANNLAAGGAIPVAAMIALLLPAWEEEPAIKGLMAAAEAKCSELRIEIAGGQTRIFPGISVPLAVVTGFGTVMERAGHAADSAAPGQDIVLSKWIGLYGTAIAAKRCRKKLLERYPPYLVEEAAGFDRYLSVLPEAQIALREGVCAMHDASEGGIFAALWELAEGAGVGLTVDMRKLPLRQETVEVCECYGLNPYELAAGGCLLMTAWDGRKLAAALEQAGIPATVVGKVTEGNDRILINGEETRYLNRPKGDAELSNYKKGRKVK